MIHCQMNYSDNTFCKSSGEGGTTSDWGDQVCEDRCELGWKLDKWINFRQRTKERELWEFGPASAKVFAGMNGVFSQTFFGKSFWNCHKEREVVSKLLEEIVTYFWKEDWESYLERGDDLWNGLEWEQAGNTNCGK